MASDVIPLPAPYGGINELTPVIALQSPECESLLNFNSTAAGISLRKGDLLYKYIATGNTNNDSNLLAAYGDTSLWMPLYNSVSNDIDIYNVDAGTVSFNSVATGSDVFEPLFFNNYLFLFGVSNHRPGFAYNGAAWGVTGYTGSGTFKPYGGNVYNNRAYLIQIDEPAYYYTDIAAITGATTKVDLGTIVSQKCTLAAIASFTLSENISSVVIQTFIMSTGEILFYTGSYPDSTDWQQVGTARIGQPVTYGTVLAYQGDALVMCDAGIVSLRDLFLKGSQAAQSLSVNSKIQKSFSELVQGIRTDQARPSGPIEAVVLGTKQRRFTAIWDRKRDLLIFGVPAVVTNGTFTLQGATYFIFDTELQSWKIHKRADTVGLSSAAWYKNKVLLLAVNGGSDGSTQITDKEGSSFYSDYYRLGGTAQYVGYDYEATSAPIPLGKSNTQTVGGIEPILSSGGTTSYTLISDLGVTTSNVQTYPSTAGSLAKPLINVGIQGSYIQYKISGSTTGGASSSAGTTQSTDIYGVNVWSNVGSRPR